MVMDINPNDFIDKNLIKTINKLNKFIDKVKKEKIKEIIEELEQFTKVEHLNVQALYILSILAEKFPQLFERNNIESIKINLDSNNVKAKINTLIIIGFYLRENLKKEKVLVKRFLDYLKDDEEEIVENILFFLNYFAENEPDIIENNSDLLLNLFYTETDINKINILLEIIDKFKLRSLSVIIRIRDILQFLIQTYDNEYILKKAIEILSKFISEVKNIKYSKKKKRNILEIIAKKILLKRYNLIIKNGNLENIINDFKKKIKNTIKNENIYYCYIKDKEKLFFIEFEKSKILHFLENKRVSLKELLEVLSEVIENTSQLKLFLLNLIQFKLIKGYVSEFYFYSYGYVKTNILTNIVDKGFIDLTEYKHIEPNFIELILEDIKSELKYTLLYNKSKKAVYSLKKIIEDISHLASKESVINLKLYHGLFDDNNFLKIIKKLPKGYLTDYHIRTNWLTNVGKTKIVNEFENSKKIGFFDKKKISEKLSIPEILLDSFINSILNSQLGFWDKFQEIFYYSKYIQDQIDKFRTVTDEKIKNQKIYSLAQKLNIDQDQIQLKINEEIQKFGEKIKSKGEISISEYMDKMGMDSKRFFNFINSLNITYFKKGDLLYLNEDKILDIKNEVRKQIKLQSKSQSQLILGNFNIKQSIVKEIIEDLEQSENLKGIFCEEGNQIIFYTKKGINNKILESTDIFFIDELFPGKKLTDDEYILIENIIKSLIKNKTLIGTYDESNRNFISSDIEFSTSYNDAINQFVNLIEYYCTIFERTFKSIRSILIKDNEIIRPAEITLLQNSFDELIKSYVRWRSQISIMKSKQTSIFLKQQSIYSKKEFELLSEEEKNEIKDFKEEQRIKEAEDIFNAWVKLFKELELNYGKLIFYQKKMLINPDDKETRKKLKELYDFLDLK